MFGHIEKHDSETWKNLPWKKFQKNLFRLQKRVWKADRAGDKQKARSLQKLILKSQAARFLAIRQVTQLNVGKKTAGIDGKTALRCKERFELEEKLRLNANNWKHKGLREIPIPKKDGTKRILKVPTISDRAWQCLAKYALEPAHEATFHARSYGFRTGRSAHDAQKKLFHNLRSSCNGINKRVIELDIKKCFDRINHSVIMENLIAPKGLKLGIFRCLKAGTNVGFPDQGTPQGGVFSPILANIALNGIEEIHQSIRYADDMVFILKQNGKFRSRPSTDNYKAFRKKVKAIINNSNYGAMVKAKKLAPIVRGWRHYHRYCKMDGARNSLYFMQKRAFNIFLVFS